VQLMVDSKNRVGLTGSTRASWKVKAYEANVSWLGIMPLIDRKEDGGVVAD